MLCILFEGSGEKILRFISCRFIRLLILLGIVFFLIIVDVLGFDYLNFFWFLTLELCLVIILRDGDRYCRFLEEF